MNPPKEAAPPALIVCGPTASGKSGLALALARRLDGAIINADSRQLYRGLPILTAQPGAAEQAAAPHRLYGVLAPGETIDAPRWAAMAITEIHAAQASAKRPILVGGTGFYIEALLRGFSPLPDIPVAIRQELRARLADEGAAALHAALKKADPATADRLAPGDGQRILRGLEVLAASGRALSHWLVTPPEPPAPSLRFTALVILPPAETLRAACVSRLDGMIAGGALDEVAAHLGLPPETPGLDAIGFRELAAHLRGEISRAAALAQAQAATWRYARRQRTWFRNRLPGDPPPANLHACHEISAQDSQSLIEKAFAIVNQLA